MPPWIKEFGTGAVKMTPAHDPTDFEIGARHGLERIQVIGFDAKMTEAAGEFAGMDRLEAREAVVEAFRKLGLLVKTEPYEIPLGHCSRCGTVIEPLISMQWWVKMTPLATGALGALKYGQLRIVPERFNKIYTDWLENIRDWNISRQLWWGHRIPAWYCQDCGEIIVRARRPDSLPALRWLTVGARPRRAGYVVLARGSGRSARLAGQMIRLTCDASIPPAFSKRATTSSSSGWRVW